LLKSKSLDRVICGVIGLNWIVHGFTWCHCSGRLDGHAADAFVTAYLPDDRTAVLDTSSEAGASPSVFEYFDPLVTSHGSTGDAAVPPADHDSIRTTEVLSHDGCCVQFVPV